MNPIDELAGRITALDLMVQFFMTRTAMEQRVLDPQTFLAGWKREMMGSLQNLSRPIDQRNDDAWASMAESLERLFSNVSKRIDAQPR